MFRTMQTRVKTGGVDSVAASIKEFGFRVPIIVDKNNVIVAGHTRLLAAKKLGLETVPVLRADDLSEEQVRAFRIADNKTAEMTEWDIEKLTAEMESLLAEGYNLLKTGFSEKEIDDLLKTDEEIEDDEFDLDAALQKATFVESGDIWTVGRHRLMCGDATKALDVDRLMDGKRANLIVTDPPYGVSYKSAGGLEIQNDSLKGNEFYQFLFDAFKNMANHLEKGGSAYIFHADTEGLNFRKAFIDAGFHLAVVSG